MSHLLRALLVRCCYKNWHEAIYQKIFRAEGMPPMRFIEAPIDLFQCVYDLRITAFESEAWREHVVEKPTPDLPDLNAYLTRRLNIDV